MNDSTPKNSLEPNSDDSSDDESVNYSDAEKLMVDISRDMRDAKFKQEEVKSSIYSSMSVIGLTFVLVGIEIMKYFDALIFEQIGKFLLGSGFFLTVSSFLALTWTMLKFHSRVGDFLKGAAKINRSLKAGTD